MYQAFIKRQQNSPWTFDEALTQAFGQDEQELKPSDTRNEE